MKRERLRIGAAASEAGVEKILQSACLLLLLAACAGVGLVPALARAQSSESTAAQAQAAGIDQIEVRVNGMACPFCAFGIEKKLRALPGAQKVNVDLGAGKATLEAPAGTLKQEQIRQAIKEAGFTAGSIEITRKAP